MIKYYALLLGFSAPEGIWYSSGAEGEGVEKRARVLASFGFPSVGSGMQLILCLYVPSVLGARIKTGIISLCNSGYTNPCVVHAFSVPRNETRLLQIPFLRKKDGTEREDKGLFESPSSRCSFWAHTWLSRWYYLLTKEH